MIKNNLGYPRIGDHRELKKACESYWSKNTDKEDLIKTGKDIRLKNWRTQQLEGIDLIPSNDFSFYDQVLDNIIMVGAIPEKYKNINNEGFDQYFAMARGLQSNEIDVPAMEMTKWFDTNYHYIVPEFTEHQQFEINSKKIVNEFKEALQNGIKTKPVILGPISFLMLGKEKSNNFNKFSLLPQLVNIYCEIFKELEKEGAEWVQIDEPCLIYDLTQNQKQAYISSYQQIRECCGLKIMVATYFEGVNHNLKTIFQLPICALHVDLVKRPEQIDDILNLTPHNISISLGVIDGRNIWINNYFNTSRIIEKAINKLGENRVMIAPSCSLIHIPCDADLEINGSINPEVIQWLCFAKQKLKELNHIHKIIVDKHLTLLERNKTIIDRRSNSPIIHNFNIKNRLLSVTPQDGSRKQSFNKRQTIQKNALKLPFLPTTSIGSFPQTTEVRKLRADFKANKIDAQFYEKGIQSFIKDCTLKQEEIGLDVLVHGEFERNDMVEYFGEHLDGFTFSKLGWVQSYGSRCVKPPIIFGDISRPKPMTVEWTKYAQSLTPKYMKGMLTGPVTILQWSFVRDDQPRKDTCLQIALSILDEVKDLEAAGIQIIQVDEPAIREGLPLKIQHHKEYLEWATFAFRLATSDVKDATQIHTHMCYSEFNDIIEHIAKMDADVITIETSRSQMELLAAFENFNYPNEIGPGVYDIHSPRIPSKEEIINLIEKAGKKIPFENLWVNPDCGLKTRGWNETQKALTNMVQATHILREKHLVTSGVN